MVVGVPELCNTILRRTSKPTILRWILAETVHNALQLLAVQTILLTPSITAGRMHNISVRTYMRHDGVAVS